MYTYRAKLFRVVDADTIIFDVDLGFRQWIHGWPFRISGISARELGDEGGPEARAYLVTLLAQFGERPCVIQSVRAPDQAGDQFPMSFGRYVANVFLPDGQDLAEYLIANGWAVRWDGRSKPVPLPPWPRPVVV